MDLSRLGQRTVAVWTRAQALELLTAGQVATLLRDGSWQSPWPGVLADSGYALAADQRAVAAVLASGGPSGVVAAGRTAARVWRLPLVDDDDPATGAQDHLHDDVLVRWHGSALTRSDEHGRVRVLHRRRAALQAQDVREHPSGMAVTTAARTLFDLSGVLTLEALVCAVDDSLRRRLVSGTELQELARRHAGHRLVRRFRAAVERADGRAESPAESLVRLLLRDALPGLVPQVEVRDGHRVVARLDLGDERLRLAVEADGRRGHAGEAMVARDRARDALTGRLGWTTERVTWFEVRRRADWTRDRVVATARRLERQLSERRAAS